MPAIPSPRGPVSERLLAALTGPPPAPADDPLADVAPPPTADPFADEDQQLALYCAYELHYRGLDGVDPTWEWQPSLLALRARLEARFEAGLRALVPDDDGDGPVAPDEIDLAIRAIAAAEAPSLSRFLQREATLDHYREVLIHRSAYQLKEADPHSWAMPRLDGPPKAALVEIQVDEYGNGRPERIHARLFADAMEALGLDPTYGAYLDRIPAPALATVNLMSLFGLHRRWRGAIVGHLALFESTSSIPNGRYAEGLRRLAVPDPRATAFFDEHVEADAVHEQLATIDLAGGLVRQQPELARDVLFGARCLAALEARWAAGVLDRWRAGRSALRATADDRERQAVAP
ncbi:iron-containing redox enzyme family protein [Patulibacter defluvii]|uniref:iron-containing redox enzyme family protein n=1 Tax=Patulibacter defluvii TaxID=3095358 RepID=UPI002A75AEAE|nr:iron-containing redox enzyme family protein [Patulibacter sp. DM4]